MTELTNLLPKDRVRALRKDYFFRLVTVATTLLIGIALVHTVLLIPSYVYATQQIHSGKAELDTLSAALAGSDEAQANARTKNLEADAAYLAQLQTIPTASAAIKAVIMLPRPGISIVGVTFTPPKADGIGTMTLSGVASDRESLRKYNQALAGLPFVKSADLPISAYAKESDIDFTITLTGTLKP
ncbi:MAG: hypothetical protein JWN64_512 [Parcubacteria group bacterium]|nr:hypothetical protein [Parcubacteria group bacterium]